MVVVDLSNSKKIEGKLNPSSDTQTHIELYRNFKNIKGIVHTHSNWATSFAQAELPIKCYGTTHADYFYGDIPCTRKLINREIENNYEQNTGKVIVETFVKNNYDYNNIPAVLVSNHGPFVWGSSPQNAVHNAYVLENIAELAYKTKTLNLKILTIDKNLLDKHYLRKHGKNAYYGQSAKRK
jgi:L-ribulose-5-phosphate 4-epimerase